MYSWLLEIRLRKPITGISVVPERADRVGPPAATGEPACFHESKSACVILPAGPEPATAVKSIPAFPCSLPDRRTG